MHRREKTSRRLALNFTPRAYAGPESVSFMRLEDTGERTKTAQNNGQSRLKRTPNTHKTRMNIGENAIIAIGTPLSERILVEQPAWKASGKQAKAGISGSAHRA